MTELDELSRTLGKIEGKLDAIKDKQDNNFPLIYEKIDKLDKAFSAHKIKIAYIAGGISTGMTLLVSYLRSKLFE